MQLLVRIAFVLFFCLRGSVDLGFCLHGYSQK